MGADRHVPVMLEEVREFLRSQQAQVLVDCTVGLGGHALALLQSMPAQGVLLGLDRDPEALELARRNLANYQDRVALVEADFRDLETLAAKHGLVGGIQGILFDLGVSSLQLERPQRGFSYQVQGPLDMRMGPGQKQAAGDLLNRLSESELTGIIRRYGEERWAARIAKFIVDERRRAPIEQTGQLVDVIKAAIPAAARRRGGHPARRTFQALRMAVNEELEALEAGLQAAGRLLAPGGRLVVLSYHSLEDRLVKRYMQRYAREPVDGQGATLEVLTRRPRQPSGRERRENPRSRSAKLRAAEKTATGGEG